MVVARSARIAIGVMAVSFGSAVVAFLFGAHVLGTWLAGPALILLAWAVIGHLITLDDDMPGEWSNPQGSRRAWYASLGELFVKVVLLVGLSAVVLSQW